MPSLSKLRQSYFWLQVNIYNFKVWKFLKSLNCNFIKNVVYLKWYINHEAVIKFAIQNKFLYCQEPLYIFGNAVCWQTVSTFSTPSLLQVKRVFNAWLKSITKTLHLLIDKFKFVCCIKIAIIISVGRKITLLSNIWTIDWSH